MLRFVELAIEIFRAEGRQIGGRTLVRGVEVVKDELRARRAEAVDDVVGRRKAREKVAGHRKPRKGGAAAAQPQAIRCVVASAC